MMFRDQVGIVAGWFRGWSECEQTVALLALLKRVTRTQARFLQLCLEHSLADCPDIHLLEAEANSAAAISQWPQEPAEAAVALLLAHLPLLQPGNAAAKAEYMKRLQKVLADAIESNRCVEESRQLLSYALIHPATTADDRSALALWLGHLEERLAPPAPRRAHSVRGLQMVLEGSRGLGELQGALGGVQGLWGARGVRCSDGAPPDVPSWLKSLRLHKYAALFAQMSYEEMMTLTERHLETQNVTKGARHKIALSIQKLRERQSVLRALEKVLELGKWGGMGGTGGTGGCGRWRRFWKLGKRGGLWALEKVPPQAFTETQKKRLQSWKQQVLKLLRAFPKKGPLDGPPGYRPPKRYLGRGLRDPPGVLDPPLAQRPLPKIPISIPPFTADLHGCPPPGTDLEINPTLESLCLSMTEHALGDGTDKTSTI
ncbi:LOW QUALITY PROTEIN: protein Smaug homolog 2 [Passer montanus]|uniref:LOW QUALITY PROTEIN: protein Smaug homolog 2 n=1 Tax=Passer montanus TaxID=9160 RepID=UPI00195F3A1A|nr:LOW QUALITY PROTEIN: protein Smaug homolog 2 [Passer montanus]